MRILALADIHGSPQGESTVRRLAAQTSPDLLAIAGDLTGQTGIRSTRDMLAGLAVPAFIVPGNMDPRAANASLTVGKARNIDLEKAQVGQFSFVGFGGNTVWEAERRANPAELEAIEKKVGRLVGPMTVFLTHVPPFGHLDSVPVPPAFSPGSGLEEHIGSHFMRRLEERFRPVLVISGHVHESRGIERECPTMHVNPGPARNGFGALIELEPAPTARLLETG